MLAEFALFRASVAVELIEVVVVSKELTLPDIPFTEVSREPTLFDSVDTVEPSALFSTVVVKLDTFWLILSVVTFISALAALTFVSIFPSTSDLALSISACSTLRAICSLFKAISAVFLFNCVSIPSLSD